MKLDWFCTTKYPLFDETERVIGVVGVARSYAEQKRQRTDQEAVDRMIEIIERNPGASHRIPDLARRVGLSERQLLRKFQALMGLSPQEFILRTRVQGAAIALRTSNESVASIAEQFGFCDQSALTKPFKRYLGITPAKYRRSEKAK